MGAVKEEHHGSTNPVLRAGEEVLWVAADRCQLGPSRKGAY